MSPNREQMIAAAAALREELVQIYAPVSADLGRVEARLREQVQSEERFVDHIQTYVFEASGKRMRPAMTLLAARFGESQRDGASAPVVDLAVAIELIHTATLVHDDVIDESDLRHQRATVNVRWGNQASVLFGDYLLAQAFRLLARNASREVISLIAETTNTICEGELVEIGQVNRFEQTEPEYLNIVRKKTAALVGAACQGGAMLAGCPAEWVRALTGFGMNFGMAFQMVDDCLDLIGDEEVLGKPLGSDLETGKVTLPIIHRLRQMETGDRRGLLNALLDGGSLSARQAAIRRLAEDAVSHGGVEYAFGQVRDYLSRAEKKLDALPAGEARDSLARLVSFAQRRVL